MKFLSKQPEFPFDVLYNVMIKPVPLSTYNTWPDDRGPDHVAKILAGNGDKAIPFFKAALTNSNTIVRRRALFWCNFLGTNASPMIPLFAAALSDPDRDIVEGADSAITSLDFEYKVKIPPEVLVPIYMRMIKSTNSRLKSLAISRLARFGTNSLPAVSDLLKIAEEDALHENEAAYALSHIAPEIFTNTPSQ